MEHVHLGPGRGAEPPLRRAERPGLHAEVRPRQQRLVLRRREDLHAHEVAVRALALRPGRAPHELMEARLAGEERVGAGPGGEERDLVLRRIGGPVLVDHLGLQPVARGEAEVHAREALHAAEVLPLGLHPREGHEGVGEVPRAPAGEERLQPLRLPFQGGQPLLGACEPRAAARGVLRLLLDVRRPPLQLLQRVEDPLPAVDLGERPDRRGPVLPEVGRARAIEERRASLHERPRQEAERGEVRPSLLGPPEHQLESGADLGGRRLRGGGRVRALDVRDDVVPPGEEAEDRPRGARPRRRSRAPAAAARTARRCASGGGRRRPASSPAGAGARGPRGPRPPRCAPAAIPLALEHARHLAARDLLGGLERRAGGSDDVVDPVEELGAEEAAPPRGPRGLRSGGRRAAPAPKPTRGLRGDGRADVAT